MPVTFAASIHGHIINYNECKINQKVFFSLISELFLTPVHFSPCLLPQPYSTLPWGLTLYYTLASDLLSLAPFLLHNSSIKSIRAVFINTNQINYNDFLLHFEWSPKSSPLFISCMFWLQPTTLTLNHLSPSWTTYQTSGLFSVLHLSQSWHLLFRLPEVIFLLLFPQPGHSHPLAVCLNDTSSERPSLGNFSKYPPM